MNRRNFLWTAGLLAAMPNPGHTQQPAGAARRGTGDFARGPIGEQDEGLQPLDGGKIGNTPAMKITDIQTFLVGAGTRNWIYVKVLTDQGIHEVKDT